MKLDEEKIVEAYLSGLNLVECEEKFSVSGPTIRKILLKKCRDKIRPSGQQVGKRKNISKVLLKDTGTVLENFFSYDPETGIFTHKTLRGGRSGGLSSQAGAITNNGYVIIGLPSGAKCLAHRLAWLWMTGKWPDHEIDHANRNRTDNRWINLRKADRSQNAQNGSIRSTNKSGKIGVFFDKSRSKYVANVMINNKSVFRKRFDTLEEAIFARKQKEIEFFGEFVPGN